MLEGARLNLLGAEVGLADAARLPLRSASVDAVVSDLPVPASPCRSGAKPSTGFTTSPLAEVARVLRPGRRAVIVTHRPIDEIAARHLTIVDRFEQRVHKSLTRCILVLERPAVCPVRWRGEPISARRHAGSPDEAERARGNRQLAQWRD